MTSDDYEKRLRDAKAQGIFSSFDNSSNLKSTESQPKVGIPDVDATKKEQTDMVHDKYERFAIIYKEYAKQDAKWSPTRTTKSQGQRKVKIDSAWYILPILMGFVGGLIGYLVVKEKDKKVAENLLKVGMAVTIIEILIFVYWLLLIFRY